MHDPEHEAAIAAATEAADWHAEQEGLAVRFARIVVAGDAAVAAFSVGASSWLIVGLERARGEWDALDSTVLGPEPGPFQSFRPSEHQAGRWTIVAAGLTAADAANASIALAGRQYVVPVVDRVYLFAVSLDGEPELEPMAISFGE